MAEFVKMKSYKILYDYKQKQWSVFVYRADGSGHLSYNTTDHSEYLAIIDLLRNEKPLYWNSNKNVIGTTDEPIGEEEA
jgi:hypothetical protein